MHSGRRSTGYRRPVRRGEELRRRDIGDDPNEQKSGKDTDNCAFFEGGRHSGEITSSESAFYLAWYLIENYGKDAAVSALLDKKAVYIKPLNNPDGSDMYRLTAQANRSSVRPVDNDNDGLTDEGPGEDLDGDGYSRQMRRFVGAGKGNAVLDSLDKSGRLLRGVQQGRGDYMLYSEGIDNDGDGRYNEDGIGGLDLHRNYPGNWRPERELTGRGWTQFGVASTALRARNESRRDVGAHPPKHRRREQHGHICADALARTVNMRADRMHVPHRPAMVPAL